MDAIGDCAEIVSLLQSNWWQSYRVGAQGYRVQGNQKRIIPDFGSDVTIALLLFMFPQREKCKQEKKYMWWLDIVKAE